MQVGAYADKSTIGDTIGVLILFREEESKAAMYFFRNRMSLGLAFDNIPGTLIFPCVSLRNNEQSQV